MIPEWYFIDIPAVNCSGCPDGSRCVRPFDWYEPVLCLFDGYTKVSDLAYGPRGLNLFHFNAVIALFLLFIFVVMVIGLLNYFKKREPPFVQVNSPPAVVKLIQPHKDPGLGNVSLVDTDFHSVDLEK